MAISVPLSMWTKNVRTIIPELNKLYPAGSWGTYLGHHPSRELAADCMVPEYRTSKGNAWGWALAHWLKDNAKRLGIWYVIFDGKIWSTKHLERGWATYVPTRAAIERSPDSAYHRNHVHVSWYANGPAWLVVKPLTMVVVKPTQGYKIVDGVGRSKGPKYLRTKGFKLVGVVKKRRDGKYLVTAFGTWYPIENNNVTLNGKVYGA